MRISDWSSDVCSSDLGYRSALGTGSRCDIDRLAQSKQRFRNRAPGPSLQSRHECGHIPPRLPQSLSTEQPYKLLDRHGVAHIPAVGADEDARAVAEDVAYPAGLFIARAASEGAAHAFDRHRALALQLLAAEPVPDRDDGAAIRTATVASRNTQGTSEERSAGTERVSTCRS